MPHSIDYQVLSGIFSQTDADVDFKDFDFLDANFGLIPTSERSPSSPQLSDWHRLRERIRSLSSEAPDNVFYKVIFLARHGQGVHNVAEEKYGTQDWDEHYSKLDGADGLQWFDARLTELGQQQARSVAALWSARERSQGMPVPESFYCSPLIRCLQTARITHAGPEYGRHGSERYHALVKEQLRETNGVHTCDRRSRRSVIKKRFPEVIFEEDFSSEDELWSAEHREEWWEQDARVKMCMDEIFETDRNTWISITSHSGASRAMMKTLGFPREWRLRPGEVLPIVVKATFDGAEESEDTKSSKVD